MAENSAIEWTTHTFNPWMGCTKVSAGCKNCYAERDFDHRFKKVQWGPGRPRVRTSAAKWREPLKWNAEAAKTGIRPRVFSLSLGDWLDPEVPIEWLADFLALVQQTPHLDWLLVTKRPELWGTRMQHVFGFEICQNPTAESGRLQLAWDWYHAKYAPDNVWVLASVEDQKQAHKRIPELLKIPAAVHGLSCEPLLGAVDLTHCWAKEPPYCTHCGGHEHLCHGWLSDGIDWVICGGESGPNARPMHPDWARGLRDQCAAAEVPFFFKQWGEWFPGGKRIFENTRVVNFGREPMWRLGKKNAGRLLDGREWNELPEVAHG